MLKKIEIIIILISILLIALLIFLGSDYSFDNACKSIGYDTSIRTGFQQYACVNQEGQYYY